MSIFRGSQVAVEVNNRFSDRIARGTNYHLFIPVIERGSLSEADWWWCSDIKQTKMTDVRTDKTLDRSDRWTDRQTEKEPAYSVVMNISEFWRFWLVGFREDNLRWHFKVNIVSGTWNTTKTFEPSSTCQITSPKSPWRFSPGNEQLFKGWINPANMKKCFMF